MKRLIFSVILTGTFVANSFGDIGTLNFINSFNTRVTLQLPWGINLGPMTGFPGEFTFQLFIAPTNTLNPLQFAPTNVRGTNFGAAGTNFGAAGRFTGGFNLGVVGVEAAEWKAILVRGWSTSLGTDYETAKLNWNFGSKGFLGESQIAPAFIFGGFSDVGPIPSSPAFGGSFGIQSGFALVGVPVPSVLALCGAGVLFLTIYRHRNRKS